jgi:NAD(P)-dependent dehydrogenase (short-subunit alcohol dehydrogenase family)
MNLQLNQKVALVTGSTAGIGLAIATGLAREGAKVVVNGRTESRVQTAISEIKGNVPDSAVEGFAGDLATVTGFESLIGRYPDLDILVNNLGIFAAQPFEEITDDDWRRFFEINVLSGVRLSRHYLPRMKARNWGRIVFISSESALQIPVEMIHYGFTKTAQLAVSRGLAETTAGTGVTVNSVLPGPTASEGVQDFVKQLARSENQTPEEFEKVFFEKARPTSLLKRFESPEEVANMVVYLCSPLASATNGAALRVDGGVLRSIA